MVEDSAVLADADAAARQGHEGGRVADGSGGRAPRDAFALMMAAARSSHLPAAKIGKKRRISEPVSPSLHGMVDDKLEYEEMVSGANEGIFEGVKEERIVKRSTSGGTDTLCCGTPASGAGSSQVCGARTACAAADAMSSSSTRSCGCGGTGCDVPPDAFAVMMAAQVKAQADRSRKFNVDGVNYELVKGASGCRVEKAFSTEGSRSTFSTEAPGEGCD